MSKLMWSTTEWTETEFQRIHIQIAGESQEWHDLPCENIPFMQGSALGSIIEQLPMQTIQIAWNGVIFGRRTLLGVRCRFKDTDAEAWYIDTGSEAVNLCSFAIERMKQWCLK